MSSTTVIEPGSPEPAAPRPVGPSGSLARLAGWSFDKRKRVLAAWVVLLIGLSVVAGMVGANYQDKFDGGNSESQQAQNLLKKQFPAQAGDTAQVVFRTTDPISTPANQAKIAALGAALAKLPHVTDVVSPVGPAGQFQISPDGHIAYTTVQIDKPTADVPKADLQRIVDTAKAARAEGMQVELGGQPISAVQQPPFGASEGIGSSPPSSSCSWPSARSSPWVCPSSRRCSASASAWPSCRCSAACWSCPASAPSWPP